MPEEEQPVGKLRKVSSESISDSSQPVGKLKPVGSMPVPLLDSYGIKDGQDSNQLENTLNDIVKTSARSISDGEKDMLRDMLNNPNLTADQAKESIQAMQGYHPKQQSNTITSPDYYVETDKNGVTRPIPLGQGERPPKNHQVSNIWGQTSKQAQDDGWYTDLSKSLFNALPQLSKSAAEIGNLISLGVTGEESEFFNRTINTSESLKLFKDENGGKTLYNPGEAEKFSELLSKDRFDASPAALWNTFNYVAESLPEFLVGAGEAGIAIKGGKIALNAARGVEGAVELGKIGKASSVFASSFAMQVGENMEAGKEAGLEGKDIFKTALMITSVQASLDAFTGLDIGAKIFNNGFRKSQSELFKQFAKAAAKKADGTITEEAFKKLGKEFAIDYGKLASVGAKEIIKDTAGEMSQEVLQSVTKNAGEQMWDNMTSDEKAKFGTDASSAKSFGDYLSAGINSLGVGPISVLTANSKKKYNEQAVNALNIVEGGQDKINEFKANVAQATRRGDLTEEERDIAFKKIDSYNKYNEQIKDLPNITKEDKEAAFKTSFNIEALKHETNFTTEELKDLDPIALAKVDAKKKLISDLQKDLNHILLKQAVQTETVVADKTVDTVAKELEPYPEERKTLRQINNALGNPKPSGATKTTIGEEEKAVNQRRAANPKFNEVDEAGNAKFNTLRPLEKKEVLHDYFDEHPELNNEIKGKVVQAQNNVWKVDLGGGKFVQFASSISPDQFVGNKDNLEGETIEKKNSSGQPYVEYKTPVTVKLEEFKGTKEGREGKRLRVLNVYNSKGEYVKSIKEKEKGNTEYDQGEIDQMVALQKKGYTAPKVDFTKLAENAESEKELDAVIDQADKAGESIDIDKVAKKRESLQPKPVEKEVAFEKEEKAEPKPKKEVVKKEAKKEAPKTTPVTPKETKVEDIEIDKGERETLLDDGYDNTTINKAEKEANELRKLPAKELFNKLQEKAVFNLGTGDTNVERPDVGLATAEYNTTLNQLEKNKDTKTIEKLMNFVEDIKRTGIVKTIRGTGGMTERFSAPLHRSLLEKSNPERGLTETEEKEKLAELEAKEAYEFNYANLPENFTGIVLYHGSPHSFDNFDINKLGTGEGAQAFGHGLYFTNKLDIAKGYANILGSKKNFWEALLNGNSISLTKEDFNFVKNELGSLGFDGSIAENEGLGEILVDGKEEFSPDVIDALSVLFGKNSNKELEGYDLNKAEIDRLYSIKKKISDPQLYKVAIHEGKDPSQYDFLNWDAPLTPEQKSKIGVSYIGSTGKDLYKTLVEKLGSQKEASNFLLSKEIDGITYKSDRGTGGVYGDGKNFVVFDPKSIRVLGINNQTITQFQKKAAVKGDFNKVLDAVKKAFPKVKVVMDSNIKGAAQVKGNTISINPEYAGLDSPIHEAGHILIDSIGYNNKVIQAAIKQLKSAPLWKKTKELYSDLNEEMLGKEVLAEAIGREGAGIFDKKVDENRFKALLSYIFDKVKQLLGIDKNIAKSLAKQIISGIGTKNLVGENETVQEKRREKSENEKDIDALYKKLQSEPDLSKFDYETLTDAYNLIITADDISGAKIGAVKKELLERIGMNLTQRSINKVKSDPKYSEEKAIHKDLSWWGKIFNTLTHFSIDFPDMIGLKDLVEKASFDKTIASKKAKKIAEKLAIKVIEDRNKKLGIVTRGTETLKQLLGNRNYKYFDYMDNGNGDLITITEAKKQGLSEAQINFLKYTREKIGEMKGLINEESHDVVMEALKMDKKFYESFQTENGVSAMSALVGNTHNINNVRIEYKDPQTGKSHITEYENIESALAKYGEKGLKEKVRAMGLIIKYNFKARRQLREQVNVDQKGEDNVLNVIRKGEYSLDEKGQLRSKFNKPRDAKRPYSKDFYTALHEFIEETEHIRYMSPLVPIINSIDYINKNGVKDANGRVIHAKKENVTEWLKEWADLHVLQRPKEHDPALDATLKFLRSWTSLSTMMFNVPAQGMNIAIGLYNNWRKDTTKELGIGLGRMFKTQDGGSLAYDLIQRYGASSTDMDSNPLSTASSMFGKIGFFGTKWGEFIIQGSGLMGKMSKEDLNSFEYKTNKYGIKELEVKSTLTKEEKDALEKRILDNINAVSDVQGKYANKDRRNFMNNEVGKAIAQYKVWMPDWFLTRFGEKGSISSMARGGFAELKKDIKAKGAVKGFWENKDFMSNLKEAMTVVLLLSLIHKDDDDDDKSSVVKMARKALGDVLFIFDPNSLKFTISRPIASVSKINDLLDAGISLSDMDAEKTGKKVVKLLPGKKVVDLVDYLDEE